MSDLAYFCITTTDGEDYIVNEVGLNETVLALQGSIASIERVYKRMR